MAFNFAAHLQKLYPQHQYTIEPLAGGLVNFTVRATRTDHDGAAPTTSDAPATLVLKQAPPYVAVVGEEAPFSQQRQVSPGSKVGRLCQADAGAGAIASRGRSPRALRCGLCS
ncbi:hypothetical protein GQ53DRAFT_752998 [Thozetella sp. PMI_491]|nr:hypothetical protein GQ53DRAFT_752998 [Thozetella sp. PMI_491]